VPAFQRLFSRTDAGKTTCPLVEMTMVCFCAAAVNFFLGMMAARYRFSATVSKALWLFVRAEF